MANPSASKLGKRTRSGLQRTVSKDSLSELNKLGDIDVLAPISDAAPECAGEESTASCIGQCQETPKGNAMGVRRPAGELSVNVSLEGLRLEEPAKSHCATEGFSSPVKSNSGPFDPKSQPHAKIKRKWWAMGSRAFSAATTSPPKKSSPTDQKQLAIPPQQVLRQFSTELLSPSSEPASPGNMEITLIDASPKWANSAPGTPTQKLADSCTTPPPLSLDTSNQEEATSAQKFGTRGAVFMRKEQNSERMHHATRTSPKKQAAPTRLRSTTLSPLVYCRQDSCHELADVLNACGSCRKALDSKKDIYMYGGEKAFCSVSCRSRLIAKEEAEAKLGHLKGSSLHMMPKLW